MQLRAVTNRPLPAVPVVPAVLVATVITAWFALIALERSPYGQLMGHYTMHGSVGAPGAVQDSLPAMLGPFTAVWLLMVIAMMLPVIAPLVMQLASAPEPTGGRARVLFLLPLGYVMAWTAFGVGAYAALRAALGAVGPSPSVSFLIGSATLVFAGVYQISPLKRRAVHRACTPPDFALLPGKSGQRWVHALALGAREGAVCIACCWALMLLMLVGVAGGSGGMLVLGSIMYVEKNAPWGRRLIMPLGLFMVGLGLMFGWGSLLGVLTLHHH